MSPSHPFASQAFREFFEKKRPKEVGPKKYILGASPFFNNVDAPPSVGLQTVSIVYLFQSALEIVVAFAHTLYYKSNDRDPKYSAHGARPPNIWNRE